MELFKNIFFNTDKVIENTEVKVTYAGYLFQNGSDEVIVHYGFGDNWENAQDIKMQKTELGYQADIYVEANSKLNFCFRNGNGEWDNNEGNNYAFKIEKNYYQEASEEIENQNYTNEEVSENSIVVYKTPSWAELIKKTFNNFVNYFSKLFSKNTENVNNNND